MDKLFREVVSILQYFTTKFQEPVITRLSGSTLLITGGITINYLSKNDTYQIIDTFSSQKMEISSDRVVTQLMDILLKQGFRLVANHGYKLQEKMKDENEISLLRDKLRDEGKILNLYVDTKFNETSWKILKLDLTLVVYRNFDRFILTMLRDRYIDIDFIE